MAVMVGNLCEFVLLSLSFSRIWHQIHQNSRNQKFLPVAYQHNHFLATTLDSTSLFTMTFWRPHRF